MKIPIAKVEKFVAEAKSDAKACMKANWLDVEGERLLATNGHMAVRTSIGVDENDVSGLIPVEVFELARKELKAISKAVGKETMPDPWLSVVCGEDAVVITNQMSNTTHMVTRPKLVGDEKYPVVDSVFPKLTGDPSVSLDGGYLADIVNSVEGATVSMWVQGPERCIVIGSVSGDSAVVLMPCRGGMDVEQFNQRGVAKAKAEATNA